MQIVVGWIILAAYASTLVGFGILLKSGNGHWLFLTYLATSIGVVLMWIATRGAGLLSVPAAPIG
jgi:hypothetical protein